MNINDRNTDTKPKNAPAPLSNALRYGLVIGAVLLVVIFILGVASIVRAVTDAADGVNTPAELAASLETMGELVTVRVKAAKVGVKAEINTGACSFSGKYFFNSFIEAGIDFSKFSEKSIVYNEADDRYQITLPHPQLSNCAPADVLPTRYDNVQSILCGGIDYEEDLDKIARYVAEGNIRDDIIRGGIYIRAQRYTSMLMQQWVKMLTGKSAEVTFASPPTTQQAEPMSCYPDPPAGWQQNEAGVWEKL